MYYIIYIVNSLVQEEPDYEELEVRIDNKSTYTTVV